MFHPIPEAYLARMRQLEEIDRQDRTDGSHRLKRLRQVPSEVGRFLAMIAASSPDGTWVEIGTSAGYSTLWLTLACRARGRKITTFEILEEKARMARETFKSCGVEDVVDFVQGDALKHLEGLSGISFCFLDCEKDLYAACYELVVPRMARGGILVADNAIDHRDTLQPLIDRALADGRLDALVVPIGNGELICRIK